MGKNKKIVFLQRWMFIISKISTRPYISKEELLHAINSELDAFDGVEEVNIHKRTLQRDIAEIRSSSYMDISIEYCTRRKGYYIPQDEKSVSKLERLFEVSSLMMFNDLKDIVIGENRPSRGLEHRFTLISAIRNTREVTFVYRKFTDDPSKTVCLQPYGLREYKHRWYLLGVDCNCQPESSDDLITYGLDRMEELTILPRKFKKNEQVKLRDKFEHCYGIYTNQKLPVERVVLSFTPLSGRYNDTCPLHESQRTLLHTETEFRVELMLKITPDFVNELLLQSDGLRVIEPTHLRDKLVEKHQKAIELLLG
ncbi:YafY family protein [Bacteroides sp. 224]|uniref:helix-turn-helix transcriptional regulator n=1 Tax=Bacteroides sp. 224 TaxID=2302936 RepID=UPI0013D4C028|nr:WYL domain-containing protein [Bacteroides sp. 224]NDV66705.1 WYL domain-containing protein [Bacteroides sp. 224]